MTAAPTPAYANVAFFRIPDFGNRQVSEQALVKGALERRVKEALEGVPAGDRVVLDAEDGLALVLFGDPARALEVAQALHGDGQAGALHAGLNHGPLALSSRGSDARVFGDGLVAAAAAARFASPQRILVTQDFAKALEASDPARAADLASAGEFTDTRVRLHSFFTPDAARGRSRRRRTVAVAVAGVVAILALGLAGREVFRKATPAIVKLEIRPRGDVFVDGAFKGRTPPLAEMEIPPGKHLVQVKSPGHRTLELNLDLAAGERLTISHTFGRNQQPGLWRDLRKRFGL